MRTGFVVKSALSICLMLACSGAVTLPARIAEAKPPAAKAAKQPIGVGAVAGPQGAKVRAKALKILRDSGSYEVTDVEDVRPGAAPETYQQMASGTGSDAIMVGSVSKAMNLTLSVYGANGARVDAIQIKGGSLPKLLKAMENELEIAVADPFERSRPSNVAKAAPVAAAPAAAPEPAPKAEPAEPPIEAAPKAKAKPDKKAKGKSEELLSEDIPASPPSEEPAESASASTEAAAPSEEESERGLRPLEVFLGLRLFNRKFAYTGQTAGPLIPYNLAIAPTIMLGGRFYPGAMFGKGPLSHIGIMARYELGIATTTNFVQPATATTPQSTASLKTNSYEYQLGLRARLPVDAHELGFFAVYGDQSFALVGDEDPNKLPYALIPDVHYHYIRVGLDARLHISKLMVGAQVAPRFLTSMKELDKGKVWFPGATGSGLDFGLLLGWEILPWISATAGLDVVRYGFDFNNQPQNTTRGFIAGGATDTYLSGFISALATFDFAGKPGAASASVSSEAPSTSDDDDKSEKSEDEPELTPPPKAKASKKKPAPEPEEAAPRSKKKAAPEPEEAAPRSKKKAAPEPEEEEEEE